MEKEYLKQDPTWKAFGITNFKSYKEQFVLTGMFHKNVPKDIVDAFKVVEHLLATAYYHYPAYDEAGAKILRIIEMAVKQKCRQLNVSLDTPSKNPNKLPRPKELKILIDKLHEAEPGKHLQEQLDRLRELRNSVIHRADHSFVGPMNYRMIRQCVIVINKIFISEKTLKQFNDHLLKMKEKIQNFSTGNLIFINGEITFPISKFEIINVALVEDKWIYNCYIQNLFHNAKGSLETHKYLTIDKLLVSIMKVSDIQLSLTLNDNNRIFYIERADHPDLLKQFDEFNEQMNQVNENDKIIYDMFIEGEVAKTESEFLYNWLWMVE